eukprot:gene8-biopygen497
MENFWMRGDNLWTLSGTNFDKSKNSPLWICLTRLLEISGEKALIVCVAGISGAEQLGRCDILSETGCGVLAGLSVCGGLLAVISSQTMVAREPSIAVWTIWSNSIWLRELEADAPGCSAEAVDADEDVQCQEVQLGVNAVGDYHIRDFQITQPVLFCVVSIPEADVLLRFFIGAGSLEHLSRCFFTFDQR